MKVLKYHGSSRQVPLARAGEPGSRECLLEEKLRWAQTLGEKSGSQLALSGKFSIQRR